MAHLRFTSPALLQECCFAGFNQLRLRDDGGCIGVADSDIDGFGERYPLADDCMTTCSPPVLVPDRSLKNTISSPGAKVTVCVVASTGESNPGCGWRLSRFARCSRRKRSPEATPRLALIPLGGWKESSGRSSRPRFSRHCHKHHRHQRRPSLVPIPRTGEGVGVLSFRFLSK